MMFRMGSQEDDSLWFLRCRVSERLQWFIKIFFFISTSLRRCRRLRLLISHMSAQAGEECLPSPPALAQPSIPRCSPAKQTAVRALRIITRDHTARGVCVLGKWLWLSVCTSVYWLPHVMTPTNQGPSKVIDLGFRFFFVCFLVGGEHICGCCLSHTHYHTR